MIEAMSAGTPVIAWRNGSVPEVIEHGRSGLVVDNIATAVDAVAAARRLDREEVRAAFEERFTAKRMAQDYVAAYAELIARTLRLQTVSRAPIKSRLPDSRDAGRRAGTCLRRRPAEPYSRAADLSRSGGSQRRSGDALRYCGASAFDTQPRAGQGGVTIAVPPSQSVIRLCGRAFQRCQDIGPARARGAPRRTTRQAWGFSDHFISLPGHDFSSVIGEKLPAAAPAILSLGSPCPRTRDAVAHRLWGRQHLI